MAVEESTCTENLHFESTMDTEGKISTFVRLHIVLNYQVQISSPKSALIPVSLTLSGKILGKTYCKTYVCREVRSPKY